MNKTLPAAAFAAALLTLPTTTFAQTASAAFIDVEGKEIGQATLTQAPTGVLIHIRVSGLTPGLHGLHLHSVGDCSPDTGFKSAAGHVGKMTGAHGLKNAAGPEPGDLPNLVVASDGVGEAELFTTLVGLSSGRNRLLDADGSAFIIHESPDDHVTQPIGGAGGRVACALIR